MLRKTLFFKVGIQGADGNVDHVIGKVKNVTVRQQKGKWVVSILTE